MITKIKYFLAIAEELNISRAAKRLYVSQQTLSTYLKNLEEEYGVLLFNRHPSLSLTPAGEILVRNYQKITQLDNNINMELLSLMDSEKGLLRVGFHSARSTMLIPAILDKYWEEYPGVIIEIIDGLTYSFEEELMAGRLDFFIGTDPREHQFFEITPLMKEQVWVAISDTLLQKYFSSEYPECKKRFSKGVDLREFTHVPFIFNSDNSRITKAIQTFLSYEHIKLPIRIKTNNGPLRVALSAKDYGAAVCTNLRLRDVYEYNRDNPEKPHLNVYPIENLKYECETFLVHHQNIYQPPYVKYFMEIVIEVFADLI